MVTQREDAGDFSSCRLGDAYILPAFFAGAFFLPAFFLAGAFLAGAFFLAPLL